MENTIKLNFRKELFLYINIKITFKNFTIFLPIVFSLPLSLWEKIIRDIKILFSSKQNLFFIRSAFMKLLIVEDENDLCRSLAKGLTKKGYAVDIAQDGITAYEQIQINEYDLILLDINLPKLDGISLLQKIRAKNLEQKILILSAKSTVQDRITGLDEGANDYLTKPFHFAELEARIRNLLRWQFIKQNAILHCGAITVDTQAKTVYKNEKPIKLTKTEYTILEYLMIHQKQIISAETLIEHIYDSQADLFSNAIKVHISSLRKKIGAQYIQNIKGLGYRIIEREA